MIREHLMHLHWSALPVISMMMFLSVFVGVVIWSYRKGANKIYSELSQLPLEKTEVKS